MRKAKAKQAAKEEEAAGGAGGDSEHADGDDHDEDGEHEHDDGDDDAHGANTSARRSAYDDGVNSHSAWAALAPRAREARRGERKALVAALCERIVADPEHNVMDVKAPPVPAGSAGGRPTRRRNMLAELQGLCADGDPLIRQLAMASCVAVFKDILPSYRIRLPSGAEAKARVKKDVRKLRDFEAALLTGYQRLLKFLEVTAKRGEAAARRAARGGGDEEGEDASGGAGAFEAERSRGDGEGGGSDGEGGEGGGGGGKSHGVSDADWARTKMAERRAARDVALGLTPYDADADTLASLGTVAVRCMCQLLTGLPSFNFRSNLIAFVVPRMNARDAGVAAACCAAVEELFVGDVSGDASVEAVRAINGMVKAAATRRGAFLRFNPAALATLLKLRVSAAKRTKRDVVSRDSRAAHRRATAEADDEVLSSLKAADAEALEERNTHSAAALRALVAAYFRILRSPGATPLLPPVLAGLAKFAHLIDVGVVTDLLANLKALLGASMATAGDSDDEEGGGAAAAAAAAGRRVKLSVEAALNCALTALRIMAGPGELLNADESAFSNFLYGTLLRLLAPGAHVYAPLAARAVGALLMSRREYSIERVAAFAQRLLSVALHLPPAPALALLSATRALLHKYPALVSMLAPPSERPATASGRAGPAADAAAVVRVDGVALGPRGEVFDADNAHALGATAWQLAALACSYHPVLAAAARDAAAHAPLLPTDDADTLYRTYDTSGGTFNPPVAAPRPHPLEVKAEARRRSALALAAAATDSTGAAPVAGSKRRRHHSSALLFLHDPPALAPWLARSLGGTPVAEDAAAAPPAASTFALHFMDRLAARDVSTCHVADGVHALRTQYDGGGSDTAGT